MARNIISRMKKMIRLGAVALALLATPLAHALEEGVDFLLAPDAAPVPARDAQIKVTEFFNFSCPACNAWQRPIDDWLEEIPEGVTWTRSPVPFSRWDGLFAKAYFVLEAFDNKDLVGAFFNAFHVERKLLNSEDRIAEWLAEEHGLDEDKASDAFSSFGVDTKMRRARRVIERFGIMSTPTFMVADRYILSPSLSKSPAKLFETMDELIAEIRDGSAI